MADNAMVVTLVSFLALVLAYRFYGRFLARRIFQLDPQRSTPAHDKQDGIDYVPTKVPVLFGHHFASIAGLGPILGPAIAVIWGWVPAVLWVVIGSIFLGAVHDLGALTVSLSYRGRSIGDVCQNLIGGRARLLFLVIIFFLMSLAMGAFVNAIAALFVRFNPDAIIPSFGLMLVAVAVGVSVYKLGAGLAPATALGLIAFGALIAWGVVQPISTHEWFATDETQQKLNDARRADAPDGARLAEPYGANDALAYFRAVGDTAAIEDLTGRRDAQGAVIASGAIDRAAFNWIFVLLAYGFIASVLPVWLLLQPRDYINSFQLYLALVLLMLGLAGAALKGLDMNVINAPRVRTHVEGAPGGMFPFLFVTIACGAISGFHSLVSSGTTVRQLNRQTDALPIGYGAMLTEGALAVLVIMACVAGLGAEAWQEGGPYTSWSSASGLGTNLHAVVLGGANFLSAVGIPVKYGMTFLAVTIVAFAMTTLDSATRLLRFNVEEIFCSLKLDFLANRYIASLVAVAGIGLFGLTEGGTTLWVLFGTSNQLLAGLTLLTVSLFLFKLGRPVWYTLIPMALMLTMTVWAMVLSLLNFIEQGKELLIGVSVAGLIMTAWLVIEAVFSFARGRGGLDFGDEQQLSALSREADQAAAAAELG